MQSIIVDFGFILFLHFFSYVFFKKSVFLTGPGSYQASIDLWPDFFSIITDVSGIESKPSNVNSGAKFN